MTRMVDADDLVGHMEIAELLGYSRTSVHEATQRPGFPAAVVQVGVKTKLWLATEVLAWQASQPVRQEPRQCGTVSGYLGGCRCKGCRSAKAEYQRAWRQRKLARRGAA